LNTGGINVKQYTLNHTTPAALRDGSAWQAAPELEIACYPWDETGYRPRTTARLVWLDDRLAVRFRTRERALRAEARGICPVVCEDSAVELFLMPVPGPGARYLNFEMNALCAMYLGAGTGRADNVLLKEEDPLQFQARSEISPAPGGYDWQLTYELPLAYLARYTDLRALAAGARMRANLYKIAEKGPLPHFGCWSPIDWPKPDFHRPEFFGELVLG
jgi:hypothetical protein